MLKKLHKIIGLSVCLIVIHLSITGIILMYPITFKLQETYFTNSFVFNLYDMYKYTDVRFLKDTEEDIGVIEGKVIAADMVIETGLNNIIGVLRADNFIFVFNNTSIILINENDYQLEIIKQENIPFNAISIGFSENNILLKSEEEKFYSLNHSLEFSLVEKNNLSFIKKTLAYADEETASYYLNQVQGPGIQALRLFADLHNGRFFGPLVMFIFAITSILVVFLSISGSYMALKPTINRYYYNVKKKKRS